MFWLEFFAFLQKLYTAIKIIFIFVSALEVLPKDRRLNLCVFEDVESSLLFSQLENIELFQILKFAGFLGK